MFKVALVGLLSYKGRILTSYLDLKNITKTFDLINVFFLFYLI